MNGVPGFLLISLILLPLLGSLLAWPERWRRRLAPAYSLVPILQLLIVSSFWTTVQAGEGIQCSWPWAPSLGLYLSFSLDGLSWLFTGLISGVGVFVFVYAAFYMADDPTLSRLYRLLLLFNAAMMGVVLADNLVLLLVFWELTSVSSFLLIGFRSHRAAACEGASKAFGLTAIGGLVMLFGILAVYAEHGTFELSVLIANSTPISTAAGLCFLAAAFTKSAQFPFHIWLPSAMEAPTPVSAYLHAATMVKAGLYLIARLTPLFADDPTWSATVTSVGAVTLVWGGVLACKQVDLKALLANSTVSQLGLIVVLLGLQTEIALFAAVLHILNHAAFKGALFLTAGTVEHEAGTRDIRQLGGLRALMPVLTVAATLASLSMAGLPPLGGFISKELFYEGVLEADLLQRGNVSGISYLLEDTFPLLTILAVAASCLTFLYSFIFFHGTFFAPAAPPPQQQRSSPHAEQHSTLGLIAPIVVLSGLAVLFGLVPGLAEALVTPAFTVMHGAPPQFHLALWHGLTPALGLSIITIAIGGSAFLLRQRFLGAIRERQAAYSFNRLYADGLTGFTRLFQWTRALYMTGSVTDYVRYLLVALIVGLSLPLWHFFAVTPLRVDLGGLVLPEYYELGLAGLMAGAAVMCCRAHSRIVLVLTLGLVGALMSIFFILFSAPDLALTQILVEAVGLVLFLLVLRYFSIMVVAPQPHLSYARGLNIGISVGIGLLVSGLLFAATVGPSLPSPIPSYYLSNSHLLAGGYNVVNVILVDFRGFDTMGEITVFSVAVLGVLAMVGLGVRGQRPLGTIFVSFPSPILQSFARLTLHLMLVFAIYLLLRGHNAPGGGFIAGVLTAVAMTFQMMAFHVGSFPQDMPWKPLRLVVAGLLLAAGTGLGSLLVGYPFLTSAIGHYSFPLLGEIELVTAMGFDIGIYLVVVGTSFGIIRTIAED